MSQIFNIQDDKVVIESLVLKNTEGTVTHSGHVDVTGNVSIGYNLKVAGTITADTFNVKNLITEQGSLASVGDWTYNTEEELNGKGFNWTWGAGSISFIFKNGKLWSTGSIDLKDGNAFMIDGTTVISSTEIGPTVTKSNLKEVGSLKKLTVTGDSTLSEFAFFNSGFGRLGLNTDEPNATLSVVENDVEIIVGSPEYGVAHIGTYTNNDVALVTDNTARVTVKNNGDVVFGNTISKSANVIVYGTLTVDNLVSDTRLDRYSPLEFKAEREGDIYGKGLLWTSGQHTRQFVILPKPDRLYSSESLDLAQGQCYYINALPVVTETGLGDSVVHSKLSSVGTLDSLAVNGETTLYGPVNASAALNAKLLVINNGNTTLSVSGSTLNTNSSISIKVAEDEAFYASPTEISIGNKVNIRRAVKLYGPVSVGVSTPDPSVDLTVKGDVSFAGKKFITGESSPSTGSHNIGDICWNSNPQPSNYIGWVCIGSGAPGVWAPFGAIGRQ